LSSQASSENNSRESWSGSGFTATPFFDIACKKDLTLSIVCITICTVEVTICKHRQTQEETMTFQQRNITASFVSFTLILGFYLVRIFQMTQSGGFNLTNMVRLWVTVIILGIVVTIIGTILTHIGSGIVQAIITGEEPVIEDIQDERDRLIDLRGTRVAYLVSSIGVFLSMLTFAVGQPSLVMFSLLILFGLVAQITGDISRLVLYGRGV
jgi:hypothetical protein